MPSSQHDKSDTGKARESSDQLTVGSDDIRVTVEDQGIVDDTASIEDPVDQVPTGGQIWENVSTRRKPRRTHRESVLAEGTGLEMLRQFVDNKNRLALFNSGDPETREVYFDRLATAITEAIEVIEASEVSIQEQHEELMALVEKAEKEDLCGPRKEYRTTGHGQPTEGQSR